MHRPQRWKLARRSPISPLRNAAPPARSTKRKRSVSVLTPFGYSTDARCRRRSNVLILLALRDNRRCVALVRPEFRQLPHPRAWLIWKTDGAKAKAGCPSQSGRDFQKSPFAVSFMAGQWAIALECGKVERMALMLHRRDGTVRAICAGACGKCARAGYEPKGRWFCPECRERIVRHVLGRIKRVRGFPPVKPIECPDELFGEVDRRWMAYSSGLRAAK